MMFKDNLFLYMSMFCYCFPLVHLTAEFYYYLFIIVVVIIIDLFEFINSSEVLGRGLNLPGEAVKDLHGHG